MKESGSFELALKENGYIVYPFKGCSMLPLLDEGFSEVKIVPSDKYDINDIVLYKVNDKYILHRINDIDNDIYIIKGDNSAYLDKVDISLIIGKVEGIYLDKKYFSIKEDKYLDYLSSLTSFNDLTDTSIYKVSRALHHTFSYFFNNVDFDPKLILRLSKNELERYIYVLFNYNALHLVKPLFNHYQIDLPLEYKDLIEKKDNIVKSNFVRLEQARNELSTLFAKEHIKHLYLKWGEIYSLYSIDYLRAANDIDVYVDPLDFNKACNVLINNKYEEIKTNDKVHKSFIYPSLGVHIELHQKLLEEDFNKVNEIINDPFSKSYIDKENSYLYHLEKEYYYLFNLAHVAKHISYYECSLANLLDGYYLINDNSINLDKLSSLLKLAALEDFNRFYIQMVKVNFSEALITPIIHSIECLLFMNASKKKALIDKKQYHSKMYYIWHKAFLDKDDLAYLYPKLKTKPYLYGYYSIKRWFAHIDKSSIKRTKNEYSSLNNNDINKIIRLYNLIGLKDYFRYEK